MFIYLTETIFPFLFDFASKLIGLSTMPLNDFQTALQLGQSIPYTNLLTGVESSMALFGQFINGTLINGFIDIITFGVPNTAPMWVALLLSCVNGFFIISIVKFLIGIVT